MPTLRTHIINANNTKALPAARYHFQQHNSLQQPKKKRIDIQPLRYVNVMKCVFMKKKKVPTKINKVRNTIEKNEVKATKKLVQSAKNSWEKGHGTIERIDKKTGDIFHLVHTKAIYEDVITSKSKIISPNDNTKDNGGSDYRAHLIRVKTPLKINQKKPSSVLPQEA